VLTNPWIAALVALFAWWFSTGVILAVVKRADRGGREAHLWAVLLAVPILFLGGALFLDTAHRSEVGAVYGGFLAALMVWGWIEMAFLCGIITGPNRYATPEGVPEWERFVRAWGAIAYHEILLVAALIGMGLFAAEAANPFAFWTFALLFFARVSAKLNLYFGVRKINTDFLPDSLAHIPSHFRIRRMNWLFPVSVTGLAFALGCFLERIADATTGAQTAGFALLAALTALALLEHWLMVLPLPDERLWRWMLPAPEPRQTPQDNRTTP
jgi:putative photosynthetic complex assembly protein 2